MDIANKISANDIQQLMDRIRHFTETPKNEPKVSALPDSKTSGQTFSGVLSSASQLIDQVAQVNQNAETVAQGWITGSDNRSLSDVVLAAEKSRLAMEGLVTVRNKVLEAYKEIMNMQV